MHNDKLLLGPLFKKIDAPARDSKGQINPVLS